MIYDTVAVFVFGITTGSLLTWIFLRYGFGLATRIIYQIKEDMPPVESPPMEQENTMDGIEEDEETV